VFAACRLAVAVCLWFEVSGLQLAAAPPEKSKSDVPEYKIKAGYLYNFLLFVNWPPPAAEEPPSNAPIVIGILGTDRFGDAFAEVEGKLVRAIKRPLQVRRLGRHGEGTDFSGCHLLFIDASERVALRGILARAHRAGIITVSDLPGFVDKGGIIGMVVQKDLLRWEINRESLRQAGVSVSSQLLRNAVRLVEKGGKP